MEVEQLQMRRSWILYMLHKNQDHGRAEIPEKLEAKIDLMPKSINCITPSLCSLQSSPLDITLQWQGSFYT